MVRLINLTGAGQRRPYDRILDRMNMLMRAQERVRPQLPAAELAKSHVWRRLSTFLYSYLDHVQHGERLL